MAVLVRTPLYIYSLADLPCAILNLSAAKAETKWWFSGGHERFVCTYVLVVSTILSEILRHAKEEDREKPWPAMEIRIDDLEGYMLIQGINESF